MPVETLWCKMKDRCPRCGSKDSKIEGCEYVANNLCEYEVRCKFCNYCIDFYSYGHLESECPIWPTLCWHTIKSCTTFFIECIYYRFKRLKNGVRKMELEKRS